MSSDVIMGFTLLLVGIFVLLVALASYLMKTDLAIKNTQHVEAFGVSVDVSISALFAVLGLAAAFGGVYLRIQDAQAKDGLLKERDQEIRRLKSEQYLNVTAWATLEGVPSKSELDNLRLTCRSYLPSNQTVTCNVGEKFGQQVQLDFSDVTKDTVLQVNIVEDRLDGKGAKWLLRDFKPLIQTLSLKKDN